MSFLDTQHKKKSMAITVIIHMILILLLFYVGLSYLDPPPENGIAI
ncbi:energy transducer TonB, partial [Flavobacteriaceae bacterium]|nr:energy transducer TonB [Flavobacteriaceae bacterium]